MKFLKNQAIVSLESPVKIKKRSFPYMKHMPYMQLRRLQEKDATECAKLFYDTIHSVNSRDYTEEQLMAWAPKVTDTVIEHFRCFLLKNISYVVEKDGRIVGFSDLDHSGYYNCLYVHKDFQGQGIASMLYQQLEQEALKLGLRELTTEASITAKQFFLTHGFRLIQEQEKLHNGVLIKNYIMKKALIY